MTEESKRPLGYPAEGKSAPVQGQLPGDNEDVVYARPVANPADATEGDEPTYIRRAHEKVRAGDGE